MPNRRYNIWRSVVLILLVIGLLRLFIYQMETLLFIAAIGGIIYYLYRRPPRWLIQMTGPRYTPPPQKSSKAEKRRSARKKRRFRVIEGNGNKKTRF